MVGYHTHNYSVHSQPNKHTIKASNIISIFVIISSGVFIILSYILFNHIHITIPFAYFIGFKTAPSFLLNLPRIFLYSLSTIYPLINNLIRSSMSFCRYSLSFSNVYPCSFACSSRGLHNAPKLKCYHVIILL